MEHERPRPTRTAPEAPARRAAGKQQAGISFTLEVLDRIDARAKKRGLSRSGVVNLAVTESLDRWERQEREGG